MPVRQKLQNRKSSPPPAALAGPACLPWPAPVGLSRMAAADALLLCCLDSLTASSSVHMLMESMEALTALGWWRG